MLLGTWKRDCDDVEIIMIDISVFLFVICLQLLSFCFPEVVKINTFLKDAINAFCIFLCIFIT